mmetsp:Transcript_14593/g.19068  ORF Transcript_14593/g.19068 Transcript_14593/m.19068 type:complete len:98 (-) Transcript_14593:2290-2583(-)
MMLSALRIVPRRCAMTSTVRSSPRRSSAAWTDASVIVSRAEVASSNKTMGGFFNKHLAIAVLCFSPPDSLSPRSPTSVSHFSGRLSINLSICASFAT